MGEFFAICLFWLMAWGAWLLVLGGVRQLGKAWRNE